MVRTRIGRSYYGADTTARTEVTLHLSPDGVASSNHVIEDAIADVFLKDAKVAIAEEIFLQALEL